jgi:hypothetical protein
MPIPPPNDALTCETPHFGPVARKISPKDRIVVGSGVPELGSTSSCVRSGSGAFALNVPENHGPCCGDRWLSPV